MIEMGPKLNIIVRLPEELRAFVLSFCNSSVVLNLCLASRATHRTCLPSLYHSVDLSTHSEVYWRQNRDYINITVPADHTRRSITSRDQSVVRRQRQFADLLKHDPDIGPQIRVLRWTIMDVSPEGTFNNDLGTYGAVQRRITPWETFQLCTRVLEIDLAFLTAKQDTNVPPSLFSTATSISLCGVVGHAVLASIFSAIDPSKLRNLEFNNVQTLADPPSIRKKLSDHDIETYGRDRAGAIQGYLTPLTGHCPSLRSLHILTTAEFIDLSTGRNGLPSPSWHLEAANEHRRYAEIGAFLSSVKHTLREFVFEHGPDIDYFGYSPGRHTNRAFAGPRHDDSLPMDVYFDSYVLPVIASGPWPRLEKIVVRGIGHWKPLDLWREECTPDEMSYLHRKTRAFRDRAELIWEAVGGDEIDIMVEDEASQPFYRLQADKRRSMTGEAS